MKYTIDEVRTDKGFDIQTAEIKITEILDYSGINFLDNNVKVPEPRKYYVSASVCEDANAVQFLVTTKSAIDMVKQDNEIDNKSVIEQFDNEFGQTLTVRELKELCGGSKYYNAYAYVRKLLKELKTKELSIED